MASEGVFSEKDIFAVFVFVRWTLYHVAKYTKTNINFCAFCQYTNVFKSGNIVNVINDYNLYYMKDGKTTWKKL